MVVLSMVVRTGGSITLTGKDQKISLPQAHVFHCTSVDTDYLVMSGILRTVLCSIDQSQNLSRYGPVSLALPEEWLHVIPNRFILSIEDQDWFNRESGRVPEVLIPFIVLGFLMCPTGDQRE